MDPLDRRSLLSVTAATAGALFTPGAALAESGDMAALRKAVAAGHDTTVKRIQDWIALPSIAAENRDMQKGADYMAALARDAGFQTVKVVPTDGAPGVFGVMDNGAKRWVGVYFMYDVKQYDPAEWTSPPLEARIVDKPGFGKVMVGRGAVNQKGPEGTFLAALHAFKASGRKPPVNLVLVAEGEEEIGSPHFRQMVTRPEVLAALKRCEGVFIPSAWQNQQGAVDVNLGAKGIVELELIATGGGKSGGPAKDVHSSYKAMIDSPAWRLVHALDTLVSADGNTPAIDGWFENVRPLTTREKALIAANAKNGSEADQKKAFGVTRWIDDLPYQQALERLASQPTVNIEGLVAGYTGPGGKTVLPGRAVAKIDLRLVPNQTRAEAEKKLRAHLDKRGFTDIAIKVGGGYDPTETDENARIIRAEAATYQRQGVTATLIPRLAGSWPGSTFTNAAGLAPRRPVRPGPRQRRARPRRIFRDRIVEPESARHRRRDARLLRLSLHARDDHLTCREWASPTLVQPSFSGRKPAPLEQRGHVGVTPAESAIGRFPVGLVAGHQQGGAELVGGRAVPDALLLEQRPGVGVHRLRPEVAVIARRIAVRREDVPELRRAVPHHHFLRHLQFGQRLALERVRVGHRRLAVVVFHVDDRARQIFDRVENPWLKVDDFSILSTSAAGIGWPVW